MLLLLHVHMYLCLEFVRLCVCDVAVCVTACQTQADVPSAVVDHAAVPAVEQVSFSCA